MPRAYFRGRAAPVWGDESAETAEKTSGHFASPVTRYYPRPSRNVDHSWLLPQCSAVVHHGGAGTTAASLEAGVPTVICSVFGDQPFWGARVTRLGVGTHVPFAKLNEHTLTNALRGVLNDRVRERAAALGARLRAENGPNEAAEAIAKHLGGPSSPVA